MFGMIDDMHETQAELNKAKEDIQHLIGMVEFLLDDRTTDVGRRFARGGLERFKREYPNTEKKS